MSRGALVALCDEVNSAVNASLAYASDEETHGVPEFWAEVKGASGIGDCDDFMLTKRRALLNRGVPHERIWLHACLAETGEGHAVLRVRVSDEGAPAEDVVLDQRFAGLETPQELVRAGYRFLSHCRSDGAGGWHETYVG